MVLRPRMTPEAEMALRTFACAMLGISDGPRPLSSIDRDETVTQARIALRNRPPKSKPWPCAPLGSRAYAPR